MATEQDGRYPAREAFVTRPSSDAVLPDEAATAIDPPRFTEEMLAEAARASRSLAESDEELAPEALVTKQRRLLPWWVVGFVMAVVGGCLGALFGLWLALG